MDYNEIKTIIYLKFFRKIFLLDTEYSNDLIC